MFLLGYDIGSSSIKAALVEVQTGKAIQVAQHPTHEMEISSPKVGWAEQDPEKWWAHLVVATQKLLLDSPVKPGDISGIGIAYQMHGLVVVDKNQKVLRPAIIWCDGRAIDCGRQAFMDLGADYCLSHLLNAPDNFTAAKLRWVQQNEPEIYEQIDQIMLPGDYIAMKLAGEICTTPSGLSEGIFWDFKNDGLSQELLDYYGFDSALIPKVVPTFAIHGRLQQKAAIELGLATGTPIAYRAGDQPNNALSLNVFQPGEVAATGGTSGVVYGVADQASYDIYQRVNAFAHVNHSTKKPRIGILLCINGAGIQHSWIKKMTTSSEKTYQQMEAQAMEIPIGADDLRILPFGNGSERMLNNQTLGAHFVNLNFNRHGHAHLYRASLEGVAFAFVYGMELMKSMGLDLSVIRVGNDNLFQSTIFSTTIASLMDCEIEMIDTTGAIGAAKAAGVGTKIYASVEEAFSNSQKVLSYLPSGNKSAMESAYAKWLDDLEKLLRAMQ